MEKDCPVARIIKILSMKWNMLILKQLSEGEGEKRFGRLLGELKPVSSRTLSKRLKELEKAWLVEKTRFNEVPPRVEYCLTDSGKDLINCFGYLDRWGRKWGSTVSGP